ncbi:unnamed protein product [Chondrus crispus]|uniref:Uncharacterized protein n=1 Tax=Chondrus crispus TaxID=2769 RepID=R7QKN0_CHOCR|nr:unnamed protein product [Chondrus crispus]CDF38333.1 unnamed protein product [Chondrus crispus]|eukprot:XP_005718218.1 unnamed protein product [Chondrus crispus]
MIRALETSRFSLYKKRLKNSRISSAQIFPPLRIEVSINGINNNTQILFSLSAFRWPVRSSVRMHLLLPHSPKCLQPVISLSEWGAKRCSYEQFRKSNKLLCGVVLELQYQGYSLSPPYLTHPRPHTSVSVYVPLKPENQTWLLHPVCCYCALFLLSRLPLQHRCPFLASPNGSRITPGARVQL